MEIILVITMYVLHILECNDIFVSVRPTASSPGSEVHTVGWSTVGRRSSPSVWVIHIYMHNVAFSISLNSTEVQNPRRKLNDKCLCLSYVFSSVLACAKSAHVFQKLSYLLCGLCL